MQDYDEEFGPNRIERNYCGDCGKQLDRDEICWCKVPKLIYCTGCGDMVEKECSGDCDK